MRASWRTKLLQRQLNINWKIAYRIITSFHRSSTSGATAAHSVQYTVCVLCMAMCCCVFSICRDMDISYFAPVHFNHFTNRMTFLNAKFAMHKSLCRARSFIPRLMLSLPCYLSLRVLPNCRMFEKTNASANADAKATTTAKWKSFLTVFLSFASPFICFIIRWMFLDVCCVTTTNRINEDDGTIRPMVCLRFDSTVSRATLFLLRL